MLRCKFWIPTKNELHRPRRNNADENKKNDKSRIKIMLRWNYYDSSHRRRCRLIRRRERISLRPMSTHRRSLAHSFIKVNYIEWDINGIQLRIRQPFVARRITSATAYAKHNHCARVLGDLYAAGIRLSFHQSEKKRSEKKTNRYKHVRRGHANQRRCQFFLYIHSVFSPRFVLNSVNGLSSSFVEISGENSERRI